jgi:hypothetical protein
MGQGIIYLESAIGKPMKFTTRIVDKARVFGHVQGTIQVLFGKECVFVFMTTVLVSLAN